MSSVDDLAGAKAAYLQAMKLGTLIAKNKIITSSTSNNTIDKSAQSVLLVEGASADAEIMEDVDKEDAKALLSWCEMEPKPEQASKPVRRLATPSSTGASTAFQIDPSNKGAEV